MLYGSTASNVEANKRFWEFLVKCILLNNSWGFWYDHEDISLEEHSDKVFCELVSLQT